MTTPVRVANPKLPDLRDAKKIYNEIAEIVERMVEAHNGSSYYTLDIDTCYVELQHPGHDNWVVMARYGHGAVIVETIEKLRTDYRKMGFRAIIDEEKRTLTIGAMPAL